MTKGLKAPGAQLSRAVLATSLALFGSAVLAQATAIPPGAPGYVTNQAGGTPVIDGSGNCWKTGAWTPQLAKEPCDAVARAAGYVPPPVAAAPAPAPAPAAQPAPPVTLVAPPAPAPVTITEPPRPVIEKVTLATDVLFQFGKADLRDSGKVKLDELADRIKGQGANVEEVVAIGHADRIATEDYNRKLSEARAEAVKSYLVQKGLQSTAVKTEGRGESQPITGDDCKRMGPERANNRKLVTCLAPDRRVEIEVLGSRTAAAQPGTAGTGTTGSASGSSSGSSSGATAGSGASK
jgi:OOP family OmpA-OmpF porin